MDRPSNISSSIRPSNFNNLSNTNVKNPLEDTKFINNSLEQTKIAYTFKIILIGDISVGKTSLLTKFIDNTFIDNYNTTIVSEFKSKTIRFDENLNINLNIWDTCGGERHKSITRQYFRNADGIILVYDIGNRESFDNIKKWVKDIEDNCNKDYVFFLIGNKCDLNDNQRKISYEEGEKISKELNLFFMEVSAKNGQNINLLFEYMTEYLCKNVENSQIEEENLLCNNSKNNFNIAYNTLNELIKNENKKKNSCC